MTNKNKVKINKLESKVLKAIDEISDEYPDITFNEISSALLKVLKDMNDFQIRVI